MGRRPLISIHNIPDLNGNVLVNVGMTEGREDLENCTSRKCAEGDTLSRVLVESLERGLRKHTSIKKDGEESVCNGITVQWLDCGTASGLLLPVVQLFEGSVVAILPKDDDFLFLEVPGLSVNSIHDARSSSVGYVVFKRNGASMSKFHTWYNNKVLIPYFKEVRKRHGFSTESNFSEPELARVYCDSDMMNRACITSYAKMVRHLKNSIAFAKFGANTTDWTQACDIGSGFRTKKSKSRTTIAESCDEAFMTTFTRILESHYILCSLLLKSLGRKHEAIVDCVATAPRVHSHAWNQEKVQAAFIEVVFLDCVTKTCPDIFQMMSKCGVDFEKNRLRRMNRQMWQQSR